MRIYLPGVCEFKDPCGGQLSTKLAQEILLLSGKNMIKYQYIYIYIPQNVIAHNVSIHLKQMATYKIFIGMC